MDLNKLELRSWEDNCKHKELDLVFLIPYDKEIKKEYFIYMRPEEFNTELYKKIHNSENSPCFRLSLDKLKDLRNQINSLIKATEDREFALPANMDYARFVKEEDFECEDCKQAWLKSKENG